MIVLYFFLIVVGGGLADGLMFVFTWPMAPTKGSLGGTAVLGFDQPGAMEA